MGMDKDWIFANEAIERLQDKLDNTEHGEREDLADDIIQAVDKICDRSGEVERNKALILLAQDYVANNDTEKIDLLKTIISNDNKTMKYTFKVLTGIDLLEK